MMCVDCKKRTASPRAAGKCLRCHFGKGNHADTRICWGCGELAYYNSLCSTCIKILERNPIEAISLDGCLSTTGGGIKKVDAPQSALSWKGSLNMGKRLKKGGERFRVSPYDLGPEPMAVPRVTW